MQPKTSSGNVAVNPRHVLAVGFMAVAGFLCGCNGPTKAGQEARAAAGARMNIINAQVQYDQAKQSFEAGQFEKASREINRAIARFPDSPSYYVLQGRINLETHQLEAALDSLKTAVEVAQSQIEKSEVASKKTPSKSDKPETPPTEPRARVALSEAPAWPLRSTLGQAHYFSGIVYQRWSEDELAYEQYLKAFENEPTNPQYLLASAESLIAMGEFDAASELLTPRMSYFEHNAALRQLQGQIALLLGDAKKAVALYSQARLLNPDDQALLEQLMWAQYAAGMYAECMESVKRLEGVKFARATTIDPQETERRATFMHMKARCLKMMGRGSESRELYLQLTRIRPLDVTVWNEFAVLAWDLEDYRHVALCSVQLIALAPNRFEGYMFKALNERHRGNLNEALKLLRQSTQVASAPGNGGTEIALPFVLLGSTLEQTGDWAAAKSSYEQALEVQPNCVEARELLQRLNQNHPAAVLSAAGTES